VVAVGVGLALTAAVFHGAWNVLVKVGGDPIATFGRVTLATAAVATGVTIPAWLLAGRPSFDVGAAGLCLVSSFLETAYLWLLSSAYRRGELSTVYPIARGSAPLLSVGVGLAVLGERLSMPQLLGVALLLVGILAVAVAQARGRATLPALMTGVAIAAYTSVDRVGVRLAPPWLYAWLLFTLMGLWAPVSLWAASRLGLYRVDPSFVTPSWRQAGLIGSFMWAGYFLVLWALSIAPLAVIAPVREVAIVAVAIWGVWRLRESRRASLKVFGALATLGGVALLAL
jgi:drug/metabolite transporter (DMT)-like permease